MTRHNHRIKKLKPPSPSAKMGTAIIQSLVANSSTREEDRLVLNAMKDSVWYIFLSNKNVDDKIYWAAAGILAAYNLGRTGIDIPVDAKKMETS